MEIKKSDLVLLLGMIEDIGERLETVGITDQELNKLIELDGAISDSVDNSSHAREEKENELLIKIARMVLANE